MRILFLLTICASVLTASAYTQRRTRPDTVVPVRPDTQLHRVSLTAIFGGGMPVSKKSVTDFWGKGISGSLLFLINVRRPWSLGVGIDASKYFFRESEFTKRFPNVPPQRKELLEWNAYLALRYTFPRRGRFSPFVISQIGISKITPLENRDVINGVRVTYYNLTGRARLSLGLSGGMDIRISSWLAFQGELKGLYIHNDPERAIDVFLRGGLNIRL